MMRNKMRARLTIKYAAHLMACVLAATMLLALLPVGARADGDETLQVKVDVKLEGGGRVRVVGSDFVRREDETQEMYASGWTRRNGSELMPSDPATGILTVPAETGEASLLWEFKAEDVHSQELYTYRITQIPGTNPNIIYDDNEYILEILIHEDNGNTIVTALLRDDDAPGGERDRKPVNCSFYNKDKPAPPTPVPTPPNPVPTPVPIPTPRPLGPKTGDLSRNALWITLAVVSLAAVGGLGWWIVKDRKKKK